MVLPARAEFKSVYDRCATNAKKTQKTRRMKFRGKIQVGPWDLF